MLTDVVPAGVFLTMASGTTYTYKAALSPVVWRVVTETPPGYVDVAGLPRMIGGFLPNTILLGKFAETSWFLVHSRDSNPLFYLLKLSDTKAVNTLKSCYSGQGKATRTLPTEVLADLKAKGSVEPLRIIQHTRIAPSYIGTVAPYDASTSNIGASKLPKNKPTSSAVGAPRATPSAAAPATMTTSATGSMEDTPMTPGAAQLEETEDIIMAEAPSSAATAAPPRFHVATVNGMVYWPALPAAVEGQEVAEAPSVSLSIVWDIADFKLRTLAGLPLDAVAVAKVDGSDKTTTAALIVWLPASRVFVAASVKGSKKGDTNPVLQLEEAITAKHRNKYTPPNATVSTYTVTIQGRTRKLILRSPFCVWTEALKAQRAALGDTNIPTYVEVTAGVQVTGLGGSPAPVTPAEAFAAFQNTQMEAHRAINVERIWRGIHAAVNVVLQPRLTPAGLPAALTPNAVAVTFPDASGRFRATPGSRRWAPDQAPLRMATTAMEHGDTGVQMPSVVSSFDYMNNEGAAAFRHSFAVAMSTDTPYLTRFFDIHNTRTGRAVSQVSPHGSAVPAEPEAENTDTAAHALLTLADNTAATTTHINTTDNTLYLLPAQAHAFVTAMSTRATTFNTNASIPYLKAGSWAGYHAGADIPCFTDVVGCVRH
jgi:hypothetical protein